MRKGFLASLAGLIAHAGLALGQAAAPQGPLLPHIFSPTGQAVEGPALTPAELAGLVPEAHPPFHSNVLGADWNAGACEHERCEPRCWASGEYLLWWIRHGSTPPLVTTGDPTLPAGGPAPGAIGAPGTHVLFGGDQDYGTFSGMRATVGGWLHNEHIWGWEASGFLLERRSVAFSAASDAAGNPPLYIPFFNAQTGKEGSFAVADPGLGLSGGVGVFSATRLWGTELNALRHLITGPSFRVDLLGGLRYLDLQESLAISGTKLKDHVFDIENSFYESFATRNYFYGAQLGARLGYCHGPLAVDVVGKVALGNNHQITNTTGSVTGGGTGAANPGTFQGGVFTQPSNLGRQEHDDFAVVPQLQLKVGYDITPRVRATLGYDFLYWNNVVRPGNQTDRTLNLSQSSQFGGGALVGAASPAPQFNRSDFFAHGVSVGLEFRY